MWLLGTSPALLADAATGCRLAGDCIVRIALAVVGAVQSEGVWLALLVAAFALPAGCTGTVAVDRIAGGIVLALAAVPAAIAVIVEHAGTVAFVVAPAGRTEALARFGRAFGTVLAVALEGAALAVGARRAAQLALVARKAGRTEAGAIDGRALGAVATIAVQITVGAVFEERAGSFAVDAAPANAAVAATRFRVAQIRVLHAAFAGLAAVGAVFVGRTDALLAALTLPAGRTLALARGTAGGIIETVALLRAVASVRVQRALVHAHLAHIAGRAFAASGYMMARRIIVAFAG